MRLKNMVLAALAATLLAAGADACWFGKHKRSQGHGQQAASCQQRQQTPTNAWQPLAFQPAATFVAHQPAVASSVFSFPGSPALPPPQAVVQAVPRSFEPSPAPLPALLQPVAYQAPAVAAVGTFSAPAVQGGCPGGVCPKVK